MKEDFPIHHFDFQQLADQLPYLISYVDKNQQYRYVNQTYEEWLNVSCDRIIGRYVWDVVGEKVYSTIKSHIQRALSGERVAFETTLPYETGSRLVEATYTPHRDDSGEIRGFFTLIRDVTQKRENERALLKSEGLLRAVVETVVDGIVTITEQGQILTVNPAVEKLFGYTSEEIIGKNVKILMPEPYQNQHDQYVSNYVATGHKKIIGIGREVMGLRKDKSVFPLELAVSETIFDSNRIFTGILRDISERKRAEEKMMALNEDLERRVRKRTHALLKYQKRLRVLTSELTLTEHRERRRLATELHDYLAQLLVVCKMELGRFRKDAAKEAENPHLKDLEKNLNTALKYTRTLIADLSPSILYDAGFIPAIHWLAQQMYQEHGLKVQVKVESEEFELQESKSLLVFQMVRELLLNIVKHALIEEAEIKVRLSPENVLEIEVLDRGVGFDLTLSPQRNSSSGHFGLFSIRERLKAIGCRFEIQSIPNQGTAAVLFIPLVSDEIKSTSAESTDRAEETDLRLKENLQQQVVQTLLVDDHKMVREGLRKVLESYPALHVVDEAADGIEAVEKALLHRPDVVLMDLNMPRMNGLEATKRIKSQLPATVVIGITMHDDNATRNAMLKAGAYAFITKGGPVEEVYHTVMNAVQNP